MWILHQVKEIMDEYEIKKEEIEKLPNKKELLENLRKSYINKIEIIIYNK